MKDAQVNQRAAAVFGDLKAKYAEVDPSSETARTVRRIAGALIAKVTDRAGVSKWEVVVFKDDSLWTMALGGKIAITTRVLSVAQSPGELAWLLACEISRITAKHANEVASEEALLGSPRSGHERQYDFWTKSRSEMWLTRVLEADVLGQTLMAKAGFDPAESIAVLRRLATVATEADPNVARRRMENLEAHLQAAVSVFEQAKAKGIHPDVEADKGVLRK
jgi:predicted Zn-dependent protease